LVIGKEFIPKREEPEYEIFEEETKLFCPTFTYNGLVFGGIYPGDLASKITLETFNELHTICRWIWLAKNHGSP
jgi:hypothetical protein